MKYKLIKEYPGSPKLGTIKDWEKDIISFNMSRYPEFWELVKEPEFEILELIQDFSCQPYNTNIWKLQSDGKYTLVPTLGKGTFTLNQLLVNSNAKIYSVKRLSDNKIFTLKDNTNNGIIKKFEKSGDMIRVYFKGKKAYNINLNTLRHIKLDYEILESVRRTVVSSEGISPEKTVILSVKRLSDGEIFSIGEKVNFKGNGCSGKHIINSFELDTNGIMIVKASVVHFPLKYIEKLENPLFTTEDGVDIKEGGLFWYVTNCFTYLRHEIAPIKNSRTDESFANILKYQQHLPNKFSTKEKAQKYIDQNKPVYSMKEIRNALTKYRFDFGIDGRQITNQIMEDLDIC